MSIVHFVTGMARWGWRLGPRMGPRLVCRTVPAQWKRGSVGRQSHLSGAVAGTAMAAGTAGRRGI